MITSLTLDTPVSDVLGERAAKRLETVSIHTVEDLLTYWPRKWRERGEDIDIALVPDGEPATVRAVILSVTEHGMKNNPRRRMLIAKCRTIHDRQVDVSFFNPWQVRKQGIRSGVAVTFSGKVKTIRKSNGAAVRTMSSPEFILDDEEITDDIAGTVVPVYPASAKAPTEWIHEQIVTVLDLTSTLLDPVPAHILMDRNLPGYDWAVRQVHKPSTTDNAELAKKRLTYDEAFAVQLSLALRRIGSKSRPTRALPPIAGGLLEAFDQRLPFTLTPGQASAGKRIAESMNSTTPANALVLGEVGSGKTIVAIRAVLQAVDAGAQAAFIAPTEVLASQHYEGLVESLKGLDINVELFTATGGAANRRRIETGLADGSIDLVVGTHVLTNGKVQFANLGLVVVDEQHRFGVEARDALRRQPVPPHMVVMTATPIPRTLAMTVYGDLDVIELDGLPAGRQPIQTVVIPTEKERWVERLWQKVGEELALGRQAFFVASLIEPSDSGTPDSEQVVTQFADDSTPVTPPASIYEIEQRVRDNLPHARVGVLHGKLEPAVKHEVMSRFAAGHLDVLVATTVIEVGVNVPNATCMVIWDADRFGIAQLHQLRGRVGRGEHAGLCLLVTTTPDGHPSRGRLDTVASTLDGYKLAQADLKTRREGDILGTGQAGRSQFRLLDLTQGSKVIAAARKDAEAIIKADPALRANRQLGMWLRDKIGDAAAENLTRA